MSEDFPEATHIEVDGDQLKGPDMDHKAETMDEPWDKDKASTMAAVLQADPYAKKRIDGLIDHLEDTRKYTQEQFDEGPLKKAKESVELATNDAAFFRDVRHEDQETMKRFDEGVSSAETELKDLEASIPGRVEEIVQKRRLEDQSQTLNSLEQAERLYDMNPGKFSEMPTAQFMDIIRSLKEMLNKRDELNYTHEDLYDAATLISQAEANQREVDIQAMRKYAQGSLLESDIDKIDLEKYGIAAEVRDSARFKNSPGLEIVDQIIKNGRYDKTPRQINDALKAFVEDLLAKRVEQFADADKKIQDFFAEQAPAEQQTP